MSDRPHQLNYHVPRRMRSRPLLLVLVLFFTGLLIVLLNLKSIGASRYVRMFQSMRNDRALMAHRTPVGQVMWDDASNQIPPPGAIRTVSDVQLFVHGRKTLRGRECLVIVSLSFPRSGHGEHLSVTLVEPATMSRYTRHHGPDNLLDYAPFIGSGNRKIYAGQPDPKDDSHFTIDYDQAGKRKKLDGWLVDVPATPSYGNVGVKISDGVNPPTVAAP